MTPSVDLRIGDCREELKKLPDKSIHTVVTSPPYWALRDYDIPRQIGLESSLEEFIEEMIYVFRDVWSVLRDDGTCWVNFGDTYRDKQLLGIPWQVALALQADGWYLRSDIIWHKPNPVPEPNRGRPTVAHEYLFLLTKSPRYFYDADAIREVKGDEPAGRNKRTVWTVGTYGFKAAHFATFPPKLIEPCILAGTSEQGCCSSCGSPFIRITEHSPEYKARLGQSWHDHQNDLGVGQRGIPSAFRGAPARITTGWEKSCQCEADTIPCTVLDPFAGTGTTGEVAMLHGRNAVLIELNPEYEKFIQERTGQQRLNLFVGESS